MGIVYGFCWRADNLLPTKEDTRVLEGEFAADVVASSDCPPQPLLGKLVHVDVEFFHKAQKVIRDVVVQVPADVFELRLNREIVDQFTEDKDEVSVSLLLRYLFRPVIAMIDDTVAVSPETCCHFSVRVP